MTFPAIPPGPRPYRASLMRVARSRDHKVDVAFRSGAVAPRVKCKVALTTQFNQTANADVYAQANWAATDDAYGMLTPYAGSGTFSFITIPFDGEYHIDFKVNWSIQSSAAHNIDCFVTKNAMAAASSIARDNRTTTVAEGGDCSPTQAIGDSLSCVAGDVIYWGTFAKTAYTIVPTSLNIPTQIVVRSA